MKPRALGRLVRYCVTTGVVACIALLCFRLLHVNATTAALSLLIGILFVSANWGIEQAIYMSVLSAIAFNYFFLPPILTFAIHDTQNWIALMAFLITGVVASQLAERARRETEASVRRRSEAERLYQFSQTLLISGDVVELLTAIPSAIAASFDMRGAALCLAASDRVYRSRPEFTEVSTEALRAVLGSREQSRLQPDVTLAPIRLGVRTTGVLAVAGAELSPETLDAIGGLIAIAIERAGAMETLSRSEAARESEQLRTALLDSVTHELRTPLTSILASVTTLRSDAEEGPRLNREERGELMTVIEEETQRLNRLVSQAVEMAQLDAHEVKLDLAPHPIKDAIERALGSEGWSGERAIEVRVADDLPPVLLDLERTSKVLELLLENAAKYSPPASAITLGAEVSQEFVITTVADRGPGVSEAERTLIFDKFYRGQSQRYRVQGTGMGLAIAKAIVEAHGGTIEVASRPGGGAVFSFSLPLAL
jgi:two-component system, OmpR family, sensor histidine kinase KdpD